MHQLRLQFISLTAFLIPALLFGEAFPQSPDKTPSPSEKFHSVCFVDRSSGDGLRAFSQSISRNAAIIPDSSDTENLSEFESDDELASARERMTGIRDDIIDYAHTFMGVPYRWGGSTPQGFDCSGYIWYVFKEYGIDLPRVSRYQQREATPVEIEDLRPGDLIFFSNSLNVNHAGIVISNTGDELEMIHASTSIGISVVDVLSSPYWEPRIHSGGRYLDVYDFIEANPQLADRAKSADKKDIMEVPEVREYARQVQRERRNRMRIATAFRAGSTGLGGELITDVTRGIHIRLCYSGMVLNNSMSGGLFGLHGSNRYSTGSLSLLANFHITERFYVTAGGAYARASTRFDYDTTSQSNFRWLTVDENSFDDLGVTHEVSSDFYPYFGIGFGRAMSRTSLLYLSAELGLMYHGGFTSTLSSDSLPADILAEQQQLLQEATSGATLLPVLNVSLSFRLF